MVFSSDKMDINSNADNVFNKSKCSKQAYYEFLVGCLASEKEYEVWWRYKRGKKYRAIAEELGVAEKTVDNIMTRLRKKLKLTIEKSKDRGNILY